MEVLMRKRLHVTAIRLPTLLAGSRGEAEVQMEALSGTEAGAKDKTKGSAVNDAEPGEAKSQREV